MGMRPRIGVMQGAVTGLVAVAMRTEGTRVAATGLQTQIVLRMTLPREMPRPGMPLPGTRRRGTPTPGIAAEIRMRIEVGMPILTVLDVERQSRRGEWRRLINRGGRRVILRPCEVAALRIRGLRPNTRRGSAGSKRFAETRMHRDSRPHRTRAAGIGMAGIAVGMEGGIVEAAVAEPLVVEAEAARAAGGTAVEEKTDRPNVIRLKPLPTLPRKYPGGGICLRARIEAVT